MDTSKLFLNTKIDAYILMQESNRFYFTGVDTSFGCVILTESKKIFVTDFRYKYLVQETLTDWDLCFVKFSEFYDVIKAQLKTIGGKNIGFEDDSLSYNDYRALKSCLDEYTLKPCGDLIKSLRAVKTDSEIENIKISQKINETALQQVLSNLKPKMTEREIYSEVVYRLTSNGSIGLAFEPIIAGGVNSAKPHNTPSAKRIEKDEVILFDMGAKYLGYCSDMSRTITLGEPAKQLQNAYKHVLEAQSYALKNIKAGITCSEADSFAREYLTANGLGEEFGHTLGHGVGIDIHEYPRVGAEGNNIILEENMVITVEPGVYLEGVGGVRIEDLVVVKKDGIQNLTGFHKNFHI